MPQPGIISGLLSINWTLFEDVNQQAGHQQLLDKAMIISANDLLFTLPLAVLIVWFAFSTWSPFARSRSRSTGIANFRGMAQRAALTTVAAVIIALSLNILLGHFLYEPRPFVSHPGVVHQLIKHVADASFPSDHEAVSGAIAFSLLFYAATFLRTTKSQITGAAKYAVSSIVASRRLVLVVAVASLVVMLLIGIARVYVGVHYPGDIAGGAVCGLLGGWAATIIQPMLEPVWSRVIRLAAVLHLA